MWYGGYFYFLTRVNDLPTLYTLVQWHGLPLSKVVLPYLNSFLSWSLQSRHVMADFVPNTRFLEDRVLYAQLHAHQPGNNLCFSILSVRMHASVPTCCSHIDTLRELMWNSVSYVGDNFCIDEFSFCAKFFTQDPLWKVNSSIYFINSLCIVFYWIQYAYKQLF